MDAKLRCNKPNGACRAPLVERAVVTTCCHIFCLRCAEELGLTRAVAEERSCPACNQHLPNTDDAVTTVLQPTEDYKTSVLSGLDPTTIMECAGRALAFWSYQTVQEIAYQEYLGKIMTDKYAHLSRAMDKVINEANAEIQTLQNKLGELGVDYKSLQQKNEDLVELYKEKNRKHQQTQHLYETLKKKFLMSNVHTAASQNANHTVHSINAGTRPETYNGTQNVHSATIQQDGSSRMARFDATVEHLYAHQRSGSISQNGSDVGAMPPPQIRPSQRSQNMVSGTPLQTHRAPLGQPIGSARQHASRPQVPATTQRLNQSYNSFPGSTQRSSGSATRQQFPAPSGRPTSDSYGLQAGMKIGVAPGRGPYIQRPASYAEADPIAGSGTRSGNYTYGR